MLFGLDLDANVRRRMCLSAGDVNNSSSSTPPFHKLSSASLNLNAVKMPFHVASGWIISRWRPLVLLCVAAVSKLLILQWHNSHRAYYLPFITAPTVTRGIALAVSEALKVLMKAGRLFTKLNRGEGEGSRRSRRRRKTTCQRPQQRALYWFSWLMFRPHYSRSYSQNCSRKLE